ncbi:agouti-related protein isoform X2 [Toxotes jaculatrix]|uniref:agouti-related protein isoform X2 n=1 Tax=Toxotes jaculatrix TaxID=941984 RepID=UPI001B3AEA44|nr:agouti-related protein isoform X2 [Toxotes jaculatrix]
MFGSVLLCCWSFSLLRLSSSLVHGNIQLDDGPASGRRTETSFLSDIGLISRLAAAGSGHAFTSSLHPSPAVVSGLPTALLRPLRHLLLPLLQRHLLLSPSWPRLPTQTHLTTPEHT